MWLNSKSNCRWTVPVTVTGDIPQSYEGTFDNKFVKVICGQYSKELSIRTLEFDGKNRWKTETTAKKPVKSGDFHVIPNGTVLVHTYGKYDKMFIYKIGENEPFISHKFKTVKSSWSKGATGWATCPKGAVAMNCSSEVNSKDAKSDHYDAQEKISSDRRSCRSLTRDKKDTHRAVAWCFSPEKISVSSR